MIRSLAAVVRHLCGLFVDDQGMAAAVLAWLVLNGLLVRTADVSLIWRGPIVLVGLAVLLSWACLRSARRRS